MANKDNIKAPVDRDPRKKRAFRTNDDLELIKVILEENPALRQRIIRTIEKQLGKQRLEKSAPSSQKPA
ncbi:MAG: hypothetical protein RJB13_2204 [Pseudomonadota bacterium]|jgi:hypothetical protein